MNELVKCAVCGREDVPSFTLDYFTIDDREVCEPCAMAIYMKARDVYPISEKQVMDVCKAGQGAAACVFGGVSGKGYVCMKHSTLHDTLEARRKEGSMIAQGDNCTGVPAFRVL